MRRTVVAATALLVGASAGYATGGFGNRSSHGSGWTYGGLNCGCFASVNATRESCRACCQNWYLTSLKVVTEGQRNDCIAFCDQMGEPCLPEGNEGSLGILES